MKYTEIKSLGSDDYFMKEAFNELRTNIQFCGQDVKTIAITSSTMNEGKTFVSLHLAKSLAEIGKKVLLLDLDMRKSVMAGRNSNAKKPKGVSEIITAQANTSECIYETQFDHLHVLFAGQYPPNPVGLLNSKHFGALMDYLKEAYDYIIVDTPPLGMVIDATIVASHCDSAILVIGNRSIKQHQANHVIQQLTMVGCNVIGVVMNHADKRKAGYYRRKRGYGYRYYSSEN